MNLFDFDQWSNDELKTAQRVLFDVGNNQKTDAEGGDFSECPTWVVLFASQYFDVLLSDEPQKTVVPKLFQARSSNDRRIRRQIEAQKLDAAQRLDWLSGDTKPALINRFGSLSVVPEWVARAAILSLEQHFHNLKGAQRQRPQKGQIIEQAEAVAIIDAQESALQKILAVSADLKGGQNG